MKALLVVAIVIGPFLMTLSACGPSNSEKIQASNRRLEKLYAEQKEIKKRERELDQRKRELRKERKRFDIESFWLELYVGMTEQEVNKKAAVRLTYGTPHRVEITSADKICYYLTAWGYGTITFNNHNTVIGWKEPDWTQPYDEIFKSINLRL